MALWLALLAPAGVHAAAEINFDAFYSGFGFFGMADVVARTRLGFTFGGQKFQFGAFGQADRMDPDTHDAVAGGSLRFGDKFFGQIDGGYLFRYQDILRQTGHGFSFSMAVGWNAHKWFRIMLPISLKWIITPELKRKTIEVVPFIGVRFVL
jgi:hypothetical protein